MEAESFDTTSSSSLVGGAVSGGRGQSSGLRSSGGSDYDEGSYITPPSAAEASQGGTDLATPEGQGGRGRRRGREDFESARSEESKDDDQSYIEEEDDISEMEGDDSMDYGGQSSVEELF